MRNIIEMFLVSAFVAIFVDAGQCMTLAPYTMALLGWIGVFGVGFGVWVAGYAPGMQPLAQNLQIQDSQSLRVTPSGRLQVSMRGGPWRSTVAPKGIASRARGVENQSQLLARFRNQSL